MYNKHQSILDKHTIQDKFKTLKTTRENYEGIWELCAKYTIPDLYLPDEVRQSGIEPEDLVVGDSIGAEIVNNFVSQIMKWAFPAQGAFFRLMPKQGTDKFDGLTEVQKNDILLRLETESMKALNQRKLSSRSFDIIANLTGLGNVVYRVPKDKDKSIQIYDLNDTVIRRTPDGKVADVIICEEFEFLYLDKKYKDYLVKEERSRSYKDCDVVPVYTHVHLNEVGKYEIHYAVDNVDLPHDGNFYTEYDCEYRVTAMTPKKNTNYASGTVQRYIALIHKANVYADTSTDTAVAGSLINWLVKSGSAIDPAEFSLRDQGQVFVGQQGDVEPIMAQVGQHLQVTEASYAKIEATLHRVFLMFTAVQRDAERVTAEEIRTISSRLEESHTGLKATIGDELQRPLAYMGLQLVDDEELNEYKDAVDVYVVTALEAMSRNAQQDLLLSTLNETSILNSVPPQVQEQLRLDKVIADLFGNRGYKSDEYVKSQEEVMDERKQMMEAQGQQAPQAPSQTQVFQANDALIDNIQTPLI